MTIQKYLLTLLLFLSVLMGLGIIVPGYLKIREFEYLEAKNYALDRSVRMREEIEQRIDVLEKAGVSQISSYVDKSKDDMIREFQQMADDPRVVRFVLNAQGDRIYGGGGGARAPLVQPSLLSRINRAEQAYFRYQDSGENWMVAFQEQSQWGWYILSMMSEQEVYLDSKKYLMYVLGVSAVVLLMVLGLSILLTRQLRRRAGRILGHLKQYGDGHYEERLQVTGPAEMGALQEGINSMIDNIEMEMLSRKSIEEEINSARLQAVGVNQDKAEYVRDMSHQTRNAMNSLCGFSELLLNTELSEKQLKYVNNVLSSSRVLSTMMTDMLALSGIEMDGSHACDVDAKVLAPMQPALDKLEVLLIGLEPLNCAYITEILSAQGVILRAVHDEAAAIQFLDESDADLIFLDIDKSKLTGDESIAYMRQNLTTYASSIPMLLMTSKADNHTIARYRRNGAASCLRKPFSATGLFKTIDEVMQVEEGYAELAKN